jgi:hypothetical protein
MEDVNEERSSNASPARPRALGDGLRARTMLTASGNDGTLAARSTPGGDIREQRQERIEMGVDDSTNHPERQASVAG